LRLRATPGSCRSITPAITATFRNVRFQQRAFRQPVLQVVPQHVLVEQLGDPQWLVRRPDPQHVVGGDEAERREAGALHAAGDQHAQRLVGVAALEAVGHQVPASAAGEALHQQVGAAGQA